MAKRFEGILKFSIPLEDDETIKDGAEKIKLAFNEHINKDAKFELEEFGEFESPDSGYMI